MSVELIPISRWSEIEQALRGSRSDEQIPKPENSIMLGSFEGNRLVGCIGAEKTWVVSPFWIEKDRRGNGLAQELANTLAMYNAEGFREMCATTNPHVEKLIYSKGFTPILGQLWRR
jgi:hypothetical protein